MKHKSASSQLDLFEQFASRRVLDSLPAQRWRIEHHINCVAHFDGNVIADSIGGVKLPDPYGS